MASEPKGAYNKTCVLNGEKYGYWKDFIRIQINFIDRNVWSAIQNGPFEITMASAYGVVVPKLEAQWNADDEKKHSCDWKLSNILISTLGVDEYYRVSHWETAKVM